MSNLVEEMPLTLLDMAKPMTDDGNDTDVSQDHSAFSGFSRNDLPSHGERAKYSSFTTGDLPDLAMELERTEGLPPLERPFKAEDLATMSLPLTRMLSETKMLNNFQRHALICLVISCTILSHLVSSCWILLNGFEKTEPSSWCSAFVSSRKMCGFGTRGQEASSSYLYKSAVINSGGSQKHSCLRIWMLGTIAPKLLVLGVLEHPDFNGLFCCWQEVVLAGSIQSSNWQYMKPIYQVLARICTANHNFLQPEKTLTEWKRSSCHFKDILQDIRDV